jgi:hypothetical protein
MMRTVVLVTGLLLSGSISAHCDEPPVLLGDWYHQTTQNGHVIGFMNFRFLPNGRFVQRWIKGENPDVSPDADGNITYFGDYSFDGISLKFVPSQWVAWTFKPGAVNHATPATGYLGSNNSSAVLFHGGNQMEFQNEIWTRGTP